MALRDIFKEPLFVAKETIKGIPQELSRQVGQPSLRAYSAFGSLFSRKPLTPETQFQKDLYGTDEPITLRKAGADFGVKESNPIAPALGVIGALGDVIPSGKAPKRVLKTGIKAGQEVAEKAPKVFKGFTDLSTKIVEKLKGRSTVSKQFIEDLTNSPDLKQPERDLIRNILNEGGADPLLTEARKYKSAEEFVKSQTNAYHGTPGKEFDEFKMGVGRNTENETNGLGIWVTPQESAAKVFSNKIEQGLFTGSSLKDVGGTVMPVSLRLKNPKVYTSTKGMESILDDIKKLEAERPSLSRAAFESDAEVKRDLFDKRDKINDEIEKLKRQYQRDAFEVFMDDRDQFAKYIQKGARWDDRYIAEGVPETNKAFIEYLKKQGHDGIIIKGTAYDAKSAGLETIDQIVSFDPKNVLTRSQLTDIWKKAQGGDQIDVTDFANKVKTELLPLKAKVPDSGFYENISLPNELRGPVADYSENIYTSPIKTSAGNVHFSDAEGLDNYFAHTRIEDIPDNGGIAGKDKFGNDIVTDRGNTRRVIEIQSDLFQKGRLEQENTIKKAQRVLDDDGTPIDREIAPIGRGNTQIRNAGETQKLYDARQAELAKLEPYRNTWHERVIREEVKQAAKDGKTKLQFPTGETAMKIEGLGQQNNRWFHVVEGRQRGLLSQESMMVGDEIRDTANSDWIITDVLGDGKFNAVPKDAVYPKNDVKFEWDKELPDGQRYSTSFVEQFDISGKVDTNNPIYKFYEKEVGKYLKNKYGAQLITDAQGVKWWEFDVKPEQAKMPVEAFGVAAPIFGNNMDSDQKRDRLFKRSSLFINKYGGN